MPADLEFLKTLEPESADLGFLRTLKPEPADLGFLGSLEPTTTEPEPDANGMVSGETYGPITPEERQRRIDAWNAGVDPDETGLWATIKNIPSDLKNFSGSAMGSLFTAASGGKFQDAVGYDEEAEGRPYLEKLAQERQRNSNRIMQTAGDSEIARAVGLSSQAMGEMIPALVGGAALKGIAGVTQATKAVFGIMAGTYGPGYFNEARQKNKTVLESLGYTAAMTGAELGVSYAGMKVAGKLGGATLAGIFGSGKVKSVSGALAGIASQGGEEVLTQYVQNIIGTVSEVNPEAWENLGRQTWDNFATGTLLGTSANVPGLLGDKVQQFIDKRSRSTARELGLGETTQPQREQIAKFAADALTADDFKKQMRALADDGGPLTATQSDYLVRLTEARARAAGESLGDYVGKRIKGIQRSNFADTQDALQQTDPTLQAKNPSAAIEFLANDGRAVIHAFESANFASMTHELGHLFRRDLADADLRTTERWAGVGKSGGKWSRFAEEKFARGFEQYMRDGKHPNHGMRNVFKKFRRWMTEIYSTIKGTALNVNIPKEMRTVYDNLFVPQDAPKVGPSNQRARGVRAPEEAYYPERDPRLLNQTQAPQEPVQESAGSPAQNPRITSAVAQAASGRTLAQPGDQTPVQPEVSPEGPIEPPEGPPPEKPPMGPQNPEQPSDRESIYEATSARQKWVREDNEFFNEVNASPRERITFAQDLDRAIAEGIPERALEIANAVTVKPRAMRPEESAGLVQRVQELKNSHEKLSAEMTGIKDINELGLREAELNRIEAEAGAIGRALDVSGSERGRWLNSQKLAINRKMDLLSVVTRAKTAKGSELTPEERGTLKAAVEKHERVNKAKERADANEKKKQNREVARLKSAISNIRQQIGLDPQKLGNVDVPGLTAEEQGKIGALRQKLEQAEAALAKMDTLPVLDRVHNRPSEKIIAELDDAISKVRAIISSKRPKVVKAPTSAEVEQSRVKSLERQLAKIEEQLASSDNVQQFNYDVASQRRAELKAEITEARKKLREKQPRDSRGVEVRKIIAIEKALAKAQQQLEDAKKGIVPPKNTKAPDAPSERRTKLDFQLRKTRQEVQDAINRLKPKGFWDYIKEGNFFLLAIKAGYDLSGVLRQGGMMVHRPVVMGKAFSKSLRAGRSEYELHKQNQALLNSVNGHEYKQVGIELMDMDTDLNKQEELVASKWVGKIPGAKASQRAYLSFINHLRAYAYDAIKAANGGNSLTLEERQRIAHGINVLSGRGNIKVLDEHMRTLGVVFWAPRLQLSRLQALTLEPLWRGTARSRWALGKEFVGSAIGMGVWNTLLLMSLRALFDEDGEEDGIETDPRSKAFIKNKVGNTIIDAAAGMSQSARIVTMLLTGQQKDSEGRIVDLKPYDIEREIARYARSKFSPSLQLAANVGTRGSYTYENMDVTTLEGLKNLAADQGPLSMQGVYKLFKEEGIGKAATLSLLNVLGASSYSIDEKEDKPSRPKRPSRPLSAYAPK